MRYLYHDLTGDSSATDNSRSAEVDQRIRIILELGDPEIVMDLRQNKGFKGTSFDEFWNEMECYFEENLLSVHERRHSDILYLPSFISVRDLRETIIERLEVCRNEFPLSTNCLVPSDRWISYQFCPKNPWYKASAQYTGRFQIKYMVQTRQLRKTHIDVHYCQAIFKYIRHFASKYKKFTCLIFADDKHKVPIGEGIPTSTGVRNKKMAVPLQMELSASDHDYTKLSITPSVSLFANIPEDPIQSFYSGQVYVSLKDTTLQASSALRHATEFYDSINQYYNFNSLPEIVIIYTDGGPDHRCNFGSVQVSLISLFLNGNFDLVIAARTAPFHS